jgi:hypothetical protein
VPEDPKLPTTRQPDISATTAAPPHPSLLTYLFLLIVSLILIVTAHWIRPDWPSLLVNMGSSLISAIVLLILIDRRLRQSEIAALLNMPARVGLALALTTSARRRRLYKFNLLQLRALGGLTGDKIASASFNAIVTQQGSFVLLGAAGSGKTTLLQMLCAARAREHRANLERPVPIFYALGRWMPDRQLDEAILEYVRAFHPIGKSALLKTFRKNGAVLILDGGDELSLSGASGRERLTGEMTRLREAYPKLTWVIGSRPSGPSPAEGLPEIEIRVPTSEQLEEILRKRNIPV